MTRWHSPNFRRSHPGIGSSGLGIYLLNRVPLKWCVENGHFTYESLCFRIKSYSINSLIWRSPILPNHNFEKMWNGKTGSPIQLVWLLKGATSKAKTRSCSSVGTAMINLTELTKFLVSTCFHKDKKAGTKMYKTPNSNCGDTSNIRYRSLSGCHTNLRGCWFWMILAHNCVLLFRTSTIWLSEPTTAESQTNRQQSYCAWRIGLDLLPWRPKISVLHSPAPWSKHLTCVLDNFDHRRLMDDCSITFPVWGKNPLEPDVRHCLKTIFISSSSAKKVSTHDEVLSCTPALQRDSRFGVSQEWCNWGPNTIG